MSKVDVAQWVCLGVASGVVGLLLFLLFDRAGALTTAVHRLLDDAGYTKGDSDE